MTAAGTLATSYNDIIQHTVPLQPNTLEQKLVNLTQKAVQPENGIKAYRISFIGVSEEQKIQFHNSQCMFLISVGQHYHEGAKLEAALKYINKHFRKVILTIGDTLQRHTHAIYANKISSSNELLQLTQNKGLEWLKRNSTIIKKTLTDYQIIRWDYWLNHPNFHNAYKDINILYNKDMEYRNAFEETARDFLSRFTKCRPGYDHNSVELCIRYLKEECAAMCLWAGDHYEFCTYPYGINQPLRQTYSKLIKNDHECFLQEIPYRLKGRIIKTVAA